MAVGTASGLILEYQFGLNWSRLSTQAGDILGPLMFYEVLAAFFLEAGFLGIMLFGLKKVGPRLHFFATCAVAIGSLISAFWILSANSWMRMIVVLSPLQIVVGDLHGQHSLKVQPMKVAAIEGSWTRPPEHAGEPLRLFAIPDMDERRNRWEVAIPRIGSLYLRHDLKGTIPALDEFPPENLPPVPIVFFAFRFMVGLGLLMVGQGLTSLVLRRRQRLNTSRWMLRGCTDGSGWISRDAVWLGSDRGRSPTFHRLWPAAHSGQSVLGVAPAGDRGALSNDCAAEIDLAGCCLKPQQPDLHAGGFCGADPGNAHL